MPRRPKRPKRVREPLQVYLAPEERALLDRLARETGLSRAEVLRQGLQNFAAAHPGKSPMLEFLDSMRGVEYPPDMGARHDDYLDEIYREGTREE